MGCTRKGTRSFILRLPHLEASLHLPHLEASLRLPRTCQESALFDRQTAGFRRLRRAAVAGFAISRRIPAGGSALAALSTLPPSCHAISAMIRPDTTDRGRPVATSSSEANRSRCLISSHAGFPDGP